MKHGQRETDRDRCKPGRCALRGRTNDHHQKQRRDHRFGQEDRAHRKSAATVQIGNRGKIIPLAGGAPVKHKIENAGGGCAAEQLHDNVGNGARSVGNRPAATSPQVTAGLKCAPEMWPTANAIAITDKPTAKAIAISPAMAQKKAPRRIRH